MRVCVGRFVCMCLVRMCVCAFYEQSDEIRSEAMKGGKVSDYSVLSEKEGRIPSTLTDPPM